MSTSIREALFCIGADAGGSFSVLSRLFGFHRGRVPTDPDLTVVAKVSVLGQLRAIQGEHVHLNVIKVGFDNIPAADQDEADEKADYAVYKARNIYGTAGLGVARVEHYAITSPESDGRDDIGSEDEADELSDEWTVPGSGIDVFVVRNISDTDFVGISPVGGTCDKDDKDDGLVGGEINRSFDEVARTFAHEIGHFLGLEHNHGDDDCPGSKRKCNNLMAQTRCAVNCGDGVRDAILLTSGQSDKMLDHCAAWDGC